MAAMRIVGMSKSVLVAFSLLVGGFVPLAAAQDYPSKSIRVIVPYPGGVPALEALLRGDVDFSVLAMGQFGPHLQAGKIRVLSVVTGARHKALPAVPTVAEVAPLPGYDFTAVAGWVMRAGTPKPIIDKLSGLVGKAAQSPEVVEKVAAFGFDMVGGTPEQMAEQIRLDVKKMARIVKAAGVTPQ